MNDKKEIINKIIRLMKELEVSAYKVAQETGLSEAGIGKIINGKSKNPNNTTLELILNYLLNLEAVYFGDLNDPIIVKRVVAYKKTRDKAFERRSEKLRGLSLGIKDNIDIEHDSDNNSKHIDLLSKEIKQLLSEKIELLKEISRLKDLIIRMQSENIKT